MKAVQSDVQAFLEGSKQFVLPLYQRRYSWGLRNWTTLAEDLERLIANPALRTHFIGSFVTAPLEHAADQSVSRYRLIDGQQRLTTLLLLLAALRDVAEARGEGELAAEIHGLYLSNQYKKGDAGKKLLPTSKDQLDFERVINRPAKSEGRVGEAYNFFIDRINSPAFSQLTDVRRAALSRLTVVSITLEEGDDAYLIFESLNAKGARLTEADLLRNYFLMRLPQDSADIEFARLWEPMERRLDDDPDTLTAFFRHYLMRGAEGARVRRDEVYQAVKQQVQAHAPTPHHVIGVLEEIAQFAGYYAKLISPQKYEGDPEIAEGIRRLHLLKVTTPYPFLLNLFGAINEGRLTAVALPKTLQLIETFLVRRLVCGIPTNQLKKIFHGLAKDAADAANTDSFLGSVGIALSQNQRCPNDAAFRYDLVHRPIYGGALRDLARYVLNRLELSFSHKEAPDPSLPTVQIEHILPQSLTDSWREELALGAGELDQAHEKWLHTLGNLTLTGYNPELGNQPFSEKRVRLLDSKFSLNKHFHGVSKWNVEAIEARAKILAEMALELWPDITPRESFSPTDADQARKRARAIRPTAVYISGKKFDVTSMLDATHRVFTEMHRRDPSGYEDAVERIFPKRAASVHPDGMWAPRLVGDKYVELHGSSISLQKLCHKLMKRMRVPLEEVVFESPRDN